MKQAGFTVVEIMIALAIAGVIGLGGASVIKALWGSNHASLDMEAINTIENAASWINRDALSSQTVSANSTSGFLLTLNRENWDDGTRYQIVYSLSGTNLRRGVSINQGTPTYSIVARNIDTDPAASYCTFSGGVIDLRLTSGIAPVSETRNYQIKIRPDVPQ